MKLSERLVAVAAEAATALELSGSNPEPYVKPGLRLLSGELVADRCRKLFDAERATNYGLAAYLDDSALQSVDIIDLDMVSEHNDDDYALIHWPGTKLCALIYPSHAGAGNCAWRRKEFKADAAIEQFMRQRNAWNTVEQFAKQKAIEASGQPVLDV